MIKINFLDRFYKLSRFMSYVIRAKKHWMFPKKCDVLIFDSCGEDLLRENLQDWSVEVLAIRGESINIPVMLVSLFVSGKRSEAYFDAFIRKVQPRLILTFIDNAVPFYRLALRNRNLKTMFVQNGWRGYYADVFEQLDAPRQSSGSYMVDFMMCFGPAIGCNYKRYLSGEVINIGALRNNRQSRCTNKIKNSFAFISQWRSDGLAVAGKMYTQKELIGDVDSCILSFLIEYSKENNKHLFIIPRTRLGTIARNDEERYFSNILGEQCLFLEFDNAGSSYLALDAAEVVIGVDSTLVYESIARGSRTAVFSIRGSMMGVQGFDYGWPKNYITDGPFWTNIPSRERFREVLDYLLSASDDDWYGDLKHNSFDDLMIFDPSNSILKKTLTQILDYEKSLLLDP